MNRHIARGITFRVVAGAALIAAAAVAVFAAPGAAPAVPAASTGSITVIATWTGTEGADFQRVLQPFEMSTGIHVSYVGTRALDQLLESDIQQGNPPDLAILSSPATLAQYQQLGYLHPLTQVIGRQLSGYDSQWRHIMTLGTGTVYALPVKTELHNVVWYDPRHWPAGRPPAESAPPTWPQLVSLDQLITSHGGTPWCVGLDSTPVSGWPATDWIGDILLHQSGTRAYQEWADGDLPWTSAPVKAAWRTWGSLVTGRQVYGGSVAALVTGWDVAGMPLFTAAPGCYLEHVPSFITLNYQQYPSHPQPGTGYDFFPFPRTGLPGETPAAANDAWEVGADLAAMFRDTPDAERLVRYLAGKQAQRIWPGIRGGGATSADQDVKPSMYPDPVGKAIAATVTSPGATLCFNAPDEMPDTLLNAFYQGVMEYLQDPGQLMDILSRLNAVQGVAYPKSEFPRGHPHFGCGSP